MILWLRKSFYNLNGRIHTLTTTFCSFLSFCKSLRTEKPLELYLVYLLRGKGAKKASWLFKASGTQKGLIDMKLAVVLSTPKSCVVGIMLFGDNITCESNSEQARDLSWFHGLQFIVKLRGKGWAWGWEVVHIQFCPCLQAMCSGFLYMSFTSMSHRNKCSRRMCG